MSLPATPRRSCPSLHARRVFWASYDTLTLTRIDRLQDNLLLLIYLLLLGVLIVLTGDWGFEPAPDREQLAALCPLPVGAAPRPYYPMAVQFLLGGLFSAYAIFYSRSATLTSTARSSLPCCCCCWSGTSFSATASRACAS